MCGFAGILSYRDRPADVSALIRMTDIQRHRGPDDQAFCLFDLGRQKFQLFTDSRGIPQGDFTSGLGFNRLSILDTSERGRQPMSSPDGRVQLVMNGEIYNSPRMREELRREGVPFRSGTDTEVVLQWYLYRGWEDLLDRIEGMFAICLVDLGQKKCLLARDPIGIKPLYLAFLPGGLLFASEAKSFLEHPQFKFEIDSGCLDEFLMFRYVADQQTLMRGVRLLPPGHWADVSEPGFQSRAYWNWPKGDEAGGELPDARDLEEKLRASVQAQMLSDVKLGCQLSGGVDSSLVNLFAADAVGEQLDAISIILEDPVYSEEPWIDKAAQRAGVHVHKFRLDAEWFVENFLRASWHLDQPLNHPNSLGILFLAHQARSRVTVLLSGEGADELMGGYPRFFYQLLLRRHPGLIQGVSRLPALGPWIRRKLCLDQAREDDRIIVSTAAMTADIARRLRPEFEMNRALEVRRQLLARMPGTTFLRRFMNYEMATYLQEMLIRQDKMTMAVSVENRVPFLDHRLVEFVRRIPDSEWVSTRCRFGKNAVEKNTKVALKRLSEKYFGPKFTYRKKSGFALPLQPFFGSPGFASIASELIRGIRNRGLFDAPAIQKLWDRRNEASGAEIEALWVMFSLEAWAGQFERRKASQSAIADPLIA